jgi:DNA polymerase III delta prime subunit
MALAAVQTAMNPEKQSIHPFFAKPASMLGPRLHGICTYMLLEPTATDSTPPPTEASTENVHHDPDYEQPEAGAPKAEKKRGRKLGAVNDKAKKSSSKGSQASLDLYARPADIGGAENKPTIAHDASGESPILEDSNGHRSKRRKTASPEPGPDCAQQAGPSDWLQQLKSEAREEDVPHTLSTPGISVAQTEDMDIMQKTESLHRPMTPPQEAANFSEPKVAPETTIQTPEKRKITPKKTLRVTKNGKLTSPDASKPTPKAEAEQTPPKKRRGRKPKAKVLPTVTIIRYGVDDESRRAFGHRIEDILNRSKRASRPAAPKKVPEKPAGPPKTTHPFFLGKAAPKKDDPEANTVIQNTQLPSPRAHKKSAVTPGRLRAESRSKHAPTQAFGPMFGSKRASRQPGLDESPWPSKEMAHVRNTDGAVLPPLQSIRKTPQLKTRKLKGAVPMVPKEDDIMAILTNQLHDAIITPTEAPKSDFEPPKDVRLPTRLLTTGVKIQEQVQAQVRAALPMAHPAIQDLFFGIEHTLTPFDLATCESQTWTHKYAPKHASHVLQIGREAATLKDWLTNLTVMTVGGKADSSKSLNDTKKPPKKKRRKNQDDFIVDSDESEEEDMVKVEVDPKDIHGKSPARPSSFRRPRWTRGKNVVLISGPHGCGKSAMVYAVAKDLGFEVFEMNPGSRRSGKDIQDKVGDMSENHLVNHRRDLVASKQELAPAEDTDSERHSTALLKDLESGRQGTMESFFKGSVGAKAKAKAIPKSKAPPRAAPASGQATLPIAQAQPKSQKQSLILFEEADVLFEEDQQFWAHVTKLAAQSKRPIVVTCNDETKIPMNELPLAAILRLSPTPVDLATDYMLVLAGREGHVLERDAVSSLYQSRDCDLRASITELDLWCQMSVGDRKGGLEWMYQRWPPGKDVDEHGRVLRVASQRTYRKGMGMLSHNMFESSSNIAFDKEHELLKESWQDWSMNPYGWTGRENKPETSALADLERLDAFSESTSAADIYCTIDLPSYGRHHEQPTDPTLPPMPNKERHNYTTAAPVMQVDHALDYSQFDTNLFIQSHLCISHAYRESCPDHGEDHLFPTTEARFTEAILRHKQDVRSKRTISRPNFSAAFDLLAYSSDATLAMNTSYSLSASSFDRTFRIIVEDLAPYVRSIVAHELVLEAQRLQFGSLLSQGGSGTKRQRTTRAARTALEGGDRQTKRRERWFDQHLNRVLVMDTAGSDWAGMGSNAGIGIEDTEGWDKMGNSAPGTQEEQGMFSSNNA